MTSLLPQRVVDAAGHALRNYRGKCENVHGHNYKVQVTLRGETLDHAGMLVDFVELKRLLRIPVAMKLSPYFTALGNLAHRLDEAHVRGDEQPEAGRQEVRHEGGGAWRTGQQPELLLDLGEHVVPAPQSAGPAQPLHTPPGAEVWHVAMPLHRCSCGSVRPSAALSTGPAIV